MECDLLWLTPPRPPLPTRISSRYPPPPQKSEQGWHVLRFVLAAILLTAAGLKAHQLITDPAARAGLYGPVWVELLTIHVEVIVAVWLISNIAPALAHRATIALFVVFAAVSLYRLLNGSADCSCFGKLSVHPGVTLALDLGLIVALLSFPPTRQGVHPGFEPVGPFNAQRSRGIASGITVVLAIALFGSVWWRIARDAALARIHAPGLVCTKPSHDFGVMPIERAARVEHRFRLTNTSSQPIRITKTDSTCSCTIANPGSSSPIAPGEETEIAVTANWADRPGRQQGRIVLTTDSETTPFISLDIRGIVQSRAVVSPASVNFGVLRSGEDAVRFVEVAEGTDGRRFSIVRVTSDPDFLKTERVGEGANPAVLPADGGPGRFRVRIAAPSTRPASDEGRVVFHTDIADLPPIELPVRFSIEEAITARPSRVLFAARQTDNIGIAQVRVTGPGLARAHIITDVGESSPFRVTDVVPQASSPTTTTTVGVECDWERVRGTIARATLRVSFGRDVKDIPVVAMGRRR